MRSLPSRCRRVFLALALLAISATGVRAVELADPLPFDTGVTLGRLPNGLTYYIRRNLKPEQRVQMWLVVKAGAVDEDDDQQGLAHFCEHMAFNGTRRYPKNELVRVLESMGIPFGSGLNASTGFDFTSYQCEAPTDRPELVAEGFSVLADWAAGITFTDAEIDKERGVILEELRLSTGADARIRDQILPVILAGAKYAERLPIGKREIIANFRRDALTRYYADWYRPDLQAVIIVGDIDPAAMTAMVREHFGGLPAPTQPRPKQHFPVPPNREPLVSIVTDTEAVSIDFSIEYKHPREPSRSAGDARREMTKLLFTMMLNRRLQDIALTPEAPFTEAATCFTQFIGHDLDVYAAYGTLKEERIDSGISLILSENERVRRFGFTATELAREKVNLLRQFESAVQERDKTPSGAYIGECIEHFVNGNNITDVAVVYQLAGELLPGIALAEVSGLAGQWLADTNILITLTAPNKPGLMLPDRDRCLALLREAGELPLTAHIDSKITEPLMDTTPTAQSAARIAYDPELACTELTFANGLRVILKPTDFKNDEIVFSAFSYGGSSLYDVDDLMSVRYTVPVVTQSGLGRFTRPALEANLTGKLVELEPYIQRCREGFSGTSSARDFATLMQMLHLYFTAPREDSAAFAAVLQGVQESVRNMREDPLSVYREAYQLAVTSHDSRTIVIPTPAQLEQISDTRIRQIFRERFANAADFTFIFVGSFDTPAAIALAETYLGSLDRPGPRETWRDVSPRFPDGVLALAVRKGIEPKAMSALCLRGDFTWNFTNRLRLRVLQEVLNIRFRDVIREEKSGVYGIGAWLEPDQFPRPQYELDVQFGCAPDSVNELVDAVFSELRDIVANGPTASELDRVRQILLRERETARRENSFWAGLLDFISYNRDSSERVSDYAEAVAQVTAEEIRDTARSVVTPDHYVRVDLLPAAAQP